jgi:hypothetical protein
MAEGTGSCVRTWITLGASGQSEDDAEIEIV